MKANFKTLAKILALSSGCSLVAMSHANNTIDFTGTVAETTCSASIDNNASSIEMGTVSVADLTANVYSAAKNFSFTLAGCPTGEGALTKARITFGGEADKFNSDYESDMVFIGFVGFLDPAKKDVKNTLKKLYNKYLEKDIIF